MDMHMLEAAGQALLIIMDPTRLAFLGIGVVLGLVLGILPGIGGLAGTALLLPFTFDMDPFSAFALLLGLGATTATGDPIPAILFGVPGGAGSAATVLDGLPMAKRGEAGRALSAAYMSSLMGGVFGALLMAIALPIMRPLILFVNSPELLALAVFGISMVATLSGNTPLRGLTAAAFGVMLAMIGSDPQTGTMRWTLNTLYLWDGMPLVPVVLGMFALPELCDLLITRASISGKITENVTAGMWQGAKDCFRHWWLILRCSWIGAMFGAIPGVGGSVIDWLAYGHAARTEKGASKTFGRGDVRGVIASESANNAKEGGALVPTVAFGVPGSAGMAILLGAFLIQGLDPGPDMLTKHLDVTYSMVWSIALANILGAGLCFLFSKQFALLATLRYTLILPTVLGFIYVGAFEGSRSWGDLYALLFFGVLGWTMKRMKWPRPPLILGFVLGETIERYLFISIQLYGVAWFARPIVVIVMALAVYSLMRPFSQDVRTQGGLKHMFSGMGSPTFRPPDLAYVFAIVVAVIMVFDASTWQFNAKIVPVIVGSLAIIFATVGLAARIFLRPALPVPGLKDETKAEVESRIHMDLASDTGHLPLRTVLIRAAIFFGWMVAFMASMATIGLIPTVPLFVIAFMRLEAREAWNLVVPQAVGLTCLIYVLFDRLLLIPWPPTLVGSLLPALKAIPSV
jgi:TctA family transporter